MAVLYAKIIITGVDIRGQHLDPQIPAAIDIFDHLGCGPSFRFRGDQGRQKVDGVMGFEIGRLKG